MEEVSGLIGVSVPSKISKILGIRYLFRCPGRIWRRGGRKVGEGGVRRVGPSHQRESGDVKGMSGLVGVWTGQEEELGSVCGLGREREGRGKARGRPAASAWWGEPRVRGGGKLGPRERDGHSGQNRDEGVCLCYFIFLSFIPNLFSNPF